MYKKRPDLDEAIETVRELPWDDLVAVKAMYDEKKRPLSLIH